MVGDQTQGLRMIDADGSTELRLLPSLLSWSLSQIKMFKGLHDLKYSFSFEKLANSLSFQLINTRGTSN